ncbi:hypothetical protein PaecuDRAFT_2060 [Paenibacillus curdlanolyticus YK9]|uniref:Uncharacterized protein n=1 Tax=Paenibacillus curdlanolyticus YK9 TaxID=717606 RepID=E0I8S9_9BACL|nr:hypothetical protein PaecuDRAFT_2060 [Paenibacillus curdlanolyticus YK9]
MLTILEILRILVSPLNGERVWTLEVDFILLRIQT